MDAAHRIDERLRARHAAERSIASGRGAAFAEKPRRPYLPQAPFWRTLLCTGSRWGELAATRWADFDEERRCLTLRAETTKSAKQRQIPLVPAVLADLETLWGVHEERLGRPPEPSVSDRAWRSRTAPS